MGSGYGSESLDQHADEKSGEQASVGGVRLVVIEVVRDEEEGDEEDQGHGGQALCQDFPPESGGPQFFHR